MAVSAAECGPPDSESSVEPKQDRPGPRPHFSDWEWLTRRRADLIQQVTGCSRNRAMRAARVIIDDVKAHEAQWGLPRSHPLWPRMAQRARDEEARRVNRAIHMRVWGEGPDTERPNRESS